MEIETGITPPRKISDDTPSYPPLAKRLNQEGTVSLRLIVTEEGDPIELEIVESAGPILDAAVREAVQKWEFEKDIKNRPLCVKILLRV